MHEHEAGSGSYNLNEDAALRLIMEGVANETGEGFFKALVKNLAGVLNTRGAWVTEYLPESRRLNSLAFWLGEGWVDEYEYEISGTPCEPVIEEKNIFRVEDNVVELYPDDPDLEPKLVDVMERLAAEADAVRDAIGRSVVSNLKTMARMGVYLERAVHQRYPDFPVRSGVHGWEEYLPPLSKNLGRLVETYESAAVAASGD